MDFSMHKINAYKQSKNIQYVFVSSIQNSNCKICDHRISHVDLDIDLL